MCFFRKKKKAAEEAKRAEAARQAELATKKHRKQYGNKQRIDCPM